MRNKLSEYVPRDSSGAARVVSVEEDKQRTWLGNGGAKGCGQDKGRRECGAWRVAMELARGRVL